VLFPRDNYGFSVPVVFRSTNSRRFRRGQWEGNGHSLGEHCTKSRRFRRRAAGHHRDALRVSLSTPTDCRRLKAPTFGPSLAKGTAKAGPTREASALGLACEDASPKAPTVGDVNVDKLTELAIITWKEHLT